MVRQVLGCQQLPVVLQKTAVGWMTREFQMEICNLRRRFAARAKALVTVEVARITASWAHTPKVHVVATSECLPVAAPLDTQGMFYRGQVWVVAESAHQDAGAVLAHEALGHLGVRRALGAGWRRFALAVQRAAAKGGDVFLRQLRHKVRAVYVDDAGRRVLRPRQEGDEILAHAAAAVFDRRSARVLVHGPVLRQAEALAAQAAREYLGMDVAVTGGQVEGVLLLSERAIRDGDLVWGLSVKARRAWRAAAVAAGLLLTWYGWMVV